MKWMQIFRVLRVVAGLALTGALLGAIAGLMIVLALGLAASIRSREFLLFAVPWLFPTGAVIGGVFGALLAPVASFTMWRHVPLGRLFLYVTLGTIVGGALGMLVFPDLIFVLLAAMGGFTVGGAVAARRSGAPSSAKHLTPAG